MEKGVFFISSVFIQRVFQASTNRNAVVGDLSSVPSAFRHEQPKVNSMVCYAFHVTMSETIHSRRFIISYGHITSLISSLVD